MVKVQVEKAFIGPNLHFISSRSANRSKSVRMYVGIDLRENLRQPDGARRFSRKFRRKRKLHLLVKRKKVVSYVYVYVYVYVWTYDL